MKHTILSLIIFPAFLALHNVSAHANDTPYSWRGNKNFSANALPQPVRYWHQKTVAMMNNPQKLWPNNPNEWIGTINTNCTSHSKPNSYGLYTYGRTMAHYVYGLLGAFRSTKDPAILAHIDRLVHPLRAKLKDTNNDGYLNWIYTHHSGGTRYCKKDTHVMDEILAHTMIANVAYVYAENTHLNPAYQGRANFWKHYLENHFIAKWKKRAKMPEFGWINRPGHQFPVFKLAHPYTASIRLYHYLHKLTGKSIYRDEAMTRHTYFFNNITLNNGAYRWRHNLFEPLNPNSNASEKEFNYWQETKHYARHTTENVVDLHYERLGQFAQDKTMEKFAKTWLQVYKNGTNTMAEFTDGKGSIPFMFERNAGIARWDPSGKLMCLAEQAHDKKIIFGKSTGKDKIHEAAWMTLNVRFAKCGKGVIHTTPQDNSVTEVQEEAEEQNSPEPDTPADPPFSPAPEEADTPVATPPLPPRQPETPVDTGPWRLYSEGNSRLVLADVPTAILNGDGHPVTLGQKNIHLQAGTDYRLVVSLKGLNVSHALLDVRDKHDGQAIGLENHGLPVASNNTWQSHEIVFTANESTQNGWIGFTVDNQQVGQFFIGEWTLEALASRQPDRQPNETPANTENNENTSCNDAITFEAESGTMMWPFETRQDSNVSGGEYILVPESTRTILKFKNKPPYVEYSVFIPHSGRYRIKGHLHAPTSKANSAFFQINDGNGIYWPIAHGDQFADAYVQRSNHGKPVGNPLEYDIEAGQHTFRFFLREDGLKADSFSFEPLNGC